MRCAERQAPTFRRRLRTAEGPRARVESGAQTISRTARSPDSAVDRRARGSACGADCTCAHPGANGGPPAPVESPWDLTPREVEVLRALAGGQSNKRMAREFWLSEQTIKYHLTNIYRKLGVSSRTEAVRQAYENRVIENPVLRRSHDGLSARGSDRGTNAHGDVAVSF